MTGEVLLGIGAELWVVALAIVLLSPHLARLVRYCLSLGCFVTALSALTVLPQGTETLAFRFRVTDAPVTFLLEPMALWLLFFGAVTAGFACWSGSTAGTPARRQYWLFGVAMTLLGALGVFGLQDAVSFLIAWEVMSLGGAVMLLAEHISDRASRSTLFMLALLETGAVAILLAFLLLDTYSGNLTFTAFAANANTLSNGKQICIGLLLLLGFGAKLGLLPFYEWFPNAYSSGSGATGALLSGIVLMAAFSALSRSLMSWLPSLGTGTRVLGLVVIVLAVLSAILCIFYAFQEEDWRRLLSFSSAENACVAVSALGTVLVFRASSEPRLAAFAWIVASLHLAGHCLAKAALFLSADAVYRGNNSYSLSQSGFLRRTHWFFGVGALFSAMSLAAMPPQAGFVSEWYIFQTMFQAFQLPSLTARLTFALAAAGLALTAAVSLATFVKLFGLGLLGDGHRHAVSTPRRTSISVFVLGLLVLALAVGLPWWLSALRFADRGVFAVSAAEALASGNLLVPLSAKFAFISPTKLIVAGPLLALIPLGLLWNTRRFVWRRVPVWYGGMREDARTTATTSLAFSNALRTFYGFIYGPTHDLTREYHERPYFVKRLVFNQEVAPIFGPYLFLPLIGFTRLLATRIRGLQSGYLNLYSGIIGLLLLLILAASLLE